VNRLVLAALLALTAALPAQAQIRLDIGINLPAPPPLVVVPGTPVYYAPGAPANVFFYGHQYWVFNNGGWFVGPSWGGPWAVVAPAFVPVPILRVPMGYYRVPPGHWKGWAREAPPRWEAQWGRDWREEPHERDWREREERWDRGRHEGHDKGKGRR
jgi:hypothetical protein